MAIAILYDRDPNLAQIVLARGIARTGTRCLNRWQQDGDQDADNRYDHEQLDQRHCFAVGVHHMAT